MINIRKSTKKLEGGCNACRKTKPYIYVWVIELALLQNGLSFRLCRECRNKLKEELQRTP